MSKSVASAPDGGELLVERIPPPAPSPAAILSAVPASARPFAFVSGRGDPALSSWSYGGVEPVAVSESLDEALLSLRGFASAGSSLPPLSTGVVGYLGYDLGFEYLPRSRRRRPDPIGLPSALFLTYEATYARNEVSKEGFVVAQPSRTGHAAFDRLRSALSSARSGPAGRLATPLAPRTARHDYEAKVDRILSAIRAGDVYQVNLTYPLVARYEGSPAAAFLRLLDLGAAPFAAYLGLDAETAVVSASPECFLDLEATTGIVSTYPIKGTRRRDPSPERDEALVRELLASEKDRAEHVMIVDLLRNDLGRIAEIGSVNVDRLAYAESFPTVHHLTSRISARLPAQVGIGGLIASCFPSGSVTGAPKQRAMELIDELEGEARGVYTGSILYLTAKGSLRGSVAIRTAQIRRGELRFGVGGGIVADSDPSAEWEETVVKARLLSEALGG